MKKKIASLLLSITTAAMILGGCGSAADDTAADTGAQTSDVTTSDAGSGDAAGAGECSGSCFRRC